MLTLNDDNQIRKAAVLIRSLDSEAVSAILTRLSAEEARVLRAAVRELGEVSDDERRVVAEALTAPAKVEPEPPVTESPAPEPTGGVELAIHQPHDEPAATYGQPVYEPTKVVSPTKANDDPLAFLGEADAAQLVTFLRHEAAQTVAVVLSCLPASRAAEVLSALPSDRQVAVLDRLSDLGDADAESLEVITTGLRNWIVDQQKQRDLRTKQLGTIEAILAAAPEGERERLTNAVEGRPWSGELSARKSLLATRPETSPPMVVEETTPVAEPLERVAPARLMDEASEEVAEPVEVEPSIEAEGHEEVVGEPVEAAPLPLLVSFDDVERFPVSAIAQVMKHTPADYLLLALAGGSEKLLGKIAGALPRRQSAALRQRVAQIGPTRLRDIEQAQESVARVASDLLRRGWISLSAA